MPTAFRRVSCRVGHVDVHRTLGWSFHRVQFAAGPRMFRFKRRKHTCRFGKRWCRPGAILGALVDGTYHLSGSFNAWQFQEMRADADAPGLHAAEVRLLTDSASFVIVRNRDWSQVFFPPYVAQDEVVVGKRWGVGAGRFGRTLMGRCTPTFEL